MFDNLNHLKSLYQTEMLCVMLIFATIWQKWQKWSRISRKTLSETAHFSIFGGIPEIEFLRFSQHNFQGFRVSLAHLQPLVCGDFLQTEQVRFLLLSACTLQKRVQTKAPATYSIAGTCVIICISDYLFNA